MPCNIYSQGTQELKLTYAQYIQVACVAKMAILSMLSDTHLNVGIFMKCVLSNYDLFHKSI